MSIRLYDPLNPSETFSATAELSYVEEKLVELLLSLGFNSSDLLTITIDEIVNKIRELFPYQRVSSELMEFGQVLTSAQVNINIRCIELTGTARRLWYRYNMVKAVVENG